MSCWGPGGWDWSAFSPATFLGTVGSHGGGAVPPIPIFLNDSEQKSLVALATFTTSGVWLASVEMVSD